MVTLHSHPMSQFSQRVLIALREKGVSWDVSVVAMQEGAHKKPPYRSINPHGKVPTIEIDGVSVYESTAILELLEELHPAPALLPGDPVARARVRMHMKACDLYFTRPMGVVVFPRRFLPEERWRKEEMTKATEEVGAHLLVLDAHLGESEYLVGDAFTLADLCYASWLGYLPMLEVGIPPHVERWAKALLARPSVAETMPPDAPAWH